MPPHPVELHPEAVEEARAAVQWYRERSPLAAETFLSELDHAVERITETPETWPQYIHGTRRFLLRRFPFSVVYRKTSSGIEIIAIVHARRRSGYWKDR